MRNWKEEYTDFLVKFSELTLEVLNLREENKILENKNKELQRKNDEMFDELEEWEGD